MIPQFIYRSSTFFHFFSSSNKPQASFGEYASLSMSQNFNNVISGDLENGIYNDHGSLAAKLKENEAKFRVRDAKNSTINESTQFSFDKNNTSRVPGVSDTAFEINVDQPNLDNNDTDSISSFCLDDKNKDFFTRGFI